MWNRKKEDELPERPAPAPHEPVRETMTAPAYPSRRTIEDAPTRPAAVIGKSLVIVGRVAGRDDLVVDGRIEGDVELPENRLTVGAGGHIQGGIKAREIVIYGTVQGNLEAGERVEIKKNARVVGDLRASRPVIEDEAYFKGNVETIRAEQPKQTVKPAPPPAPAVAAAAASTASAASTAPSESQSPLLVKPAETRRG